jgi:hypothetical protein
MAAWLLPKCLPRESTRAIRVRDQASSAESDAVPELTHHPDLQLSFSVSKMSTGPHEG